MENGRADSFPYADVILTAALRVKPAGLKRLEAEEAAKKKTANGKGRKK
jgi:hypothetical protein